MKLASTKMLIDTWHETRSVTQKSARCPSYHHIFVRKIFIWYSLDQPTPILKKSCFVIIMSEQDVSDVYGAAPHGSNWHLHNDIGQVLDTFKIKLPHLACFYCLCFPVNFLSLQISIFPCCATAESAFLSISSSTPSPAAHSSSMLSLPWQLWYMSPAIPEQAQLVFDLSFSYHCQP